MKELSDYLLILRKYAVLLTGVFAALLIAGSIYVNTRGVEYAASATVQIKKRPGTWLSGNDIWIDEDQRFISDQVYRIRNDSELARRALGRMRSWAEKEGLPAAWAGGVDAAALARAAASLQPESLPGRISVQPIPETSYYAIKARGPDTVVLVALANAYADEIVELFRDENLRAVRGQVDGWQKEWLDRRDLARDRLSALRGDLSRLQEEHPEIDGARRVNPAALELEQARRSLADAREARDEKDETMRAATAILRGEGLELASRESDGVKSFALLPPHPGTGRDPRLAPAVQALAAVARDENVLRTRDQLRGLEDLDRTMADTHRESSPERVALRKQRTGLEATLAAQIEAALCALARGAEEAGGRVARLEARVASLDGAARQGAVVLGRMEAIDKRVGDLQKEIDSYDGHIAEAGRVRKGVIEAGVTAQSLVRKIDDARVSGAVRVAPDRVRIWSFTLIGGLLVMAGLVYVLQALDDTVKSRDDYDRLVLGLPLLGVVPAIPPGPSPAAGERPLVALQGPTGSPAVESFRALRTTLQYAGDGKAPRVVLLTSSGPREGKTTLTANLAASFARGGPRTLLVDGDLRRPSVHLATGGANRVGLSNVLAGTARLEDAVAPSGVEPNLFVLTSGPIPPDPAELLSSPRLKQVIQEACRTFDLVIIDSPPVASVTDPCILAREADAVVLVIAHGRTSIQLVRRARESLHAVGARVQGAVINNASPGRGLFGDAYYGRAYRYHTFGYGALGYADVSVRNN